MRKIIISISVVVMALMSAASASAATTFPGRNGTIAFTKLSEGVWTVDPASGKTKPLLRAGSHDVVWAPGGKRIAYVREGRIFVATSAGKDVSAVPHPKRTSDGAPQWSKNGNQLTFVRTKASGGSAVYALRVGSHLPKNISGWAKHKSYRSPSWAPSGREMVYEEYDETAARLLVKNLASGSVRTLTSLSDVTESSQAAWSPTGKKILYRDSANELYTIWADGTHRAVISDGESYDGSWSPDGTKIAFIEDPSDDHISISDVDGTVVWIPIDKGAYIRLGAPVWSPDGTTLAFTLQGDTAYDVLMLDIATGSQRFVVKNASSDMLSWQSVRLYR